MEYSVLLEVESGIATIYLNEPKSLNALSVPIKKGLMDALIKSEQDPSIKVIIIVGNGGAFCSGGDIKTLGTGETTIQSKQRMDGAKKLIQTIYEMKKPIIAAVHGYAAGAGFSIALASDIIVAEKDTKFVLAFKKLGVIPDCGAHYFLSKIIGPWKAKEWIWSGSTITAEEGMKYGFVNRLVNKEEAYNIAKEMALDLSGGPVQAFGFTKSIINHSFNQNIEEVLEQEGYAQSILFQTQDHQEGVTAYHEKRTPKFTGE